MNPLWKKLLLANVPRSPEGEQGARPEAPPPPPDEGDKDLSDGEIREILAFDPFSVLKPPAQEGAEDAEEGKEPPAPAEAGDASPKPPATPPAPAPEAAQGEEDEGARLREAVAKLLGTQPAKPEAQQPAPAPTPEVKPAASQAPAEGEFQGYNFQVPDEVIGAIGSDDPAVVRKGVNALVNGLANKLAKDFGGMMAQAAQVIQQKAVEAALGQVNVKSQEQQVRDDFYGSFKDLKEVKDRLPAFDGLVWQTATQLMQASQTKGWTPEFRDQLGSVLRLQLGLAAPGSNGKAAPAGKPAPRKASFSAGGAPPSRPADGAGGKDFMDVLSAGH